MKVHLGERLFLAAAVLGAMALMAAGFFAALAVRSALADPGGPVPNPGHAWTELQDHGVSGSDYWLGTTDNGALELRVNAARALRLEPNATSPNVIGGYSANSATAGVKGATIGGGGYSSYTNSVTDDYSTVGGGSVNRAGDNDADTSDARHATVGGGTGNTASAGVATVGGGFSNTASGTASAVGGGNFNTASSFYATVPGGDRNTAAGAYSFAAGRRAKANHLGTFVWADSTDADFASTTVDQFLVRANGGVSLNVTSGGLRLESNATSPNVIGGYSGNTVTAGAVGAAICGGGASANTNRVTDDYGTVGGGYNNQAGDGAGTTSGASYATVGGGNFNTASGPAATVGGGYSNTASQLDATVGGGYSNTASATAATVSGGDSNTASGSRSTVPGGGSNNAAGSDSFAAGHYASATHDGSFVWSSAESTSSYDTNTFTVRAHNGSKFYTASGTGTGVVLAAGGTGWSSISDRNQKENFTPVDGQDVLASLAEIPISAWNLKSQDPSIRHMGPVAQDFSAAFGLGEDGLYINTVDADGVALAAIQGLYGMVQGLQAENADLEARVTALEAGAGTSAASAEPAFPGLTVGWLALLGGLVVVGLVVAQRRLAGGQR